MAQSDREGSAHPPGGGARKRDIEEDRHEQQEAAIVTSDAGSHQPVHAKNFDSG